MNEARYITAGQRMTQSQIKRVIQSQLDDMKKHDHYKKDLKFSADAQEYDLKELVTTIFNLNEALLDGRAVFAECEKEPRNLDSGKHYFSVHFVTKNGKIDTVWCHKYYWYIGQEKQSRDQSVRAYIYSSGAIGMGRLLDATDGLFTRLKSITGTYAQIS